ncbi:MAG: response regulator [Magnetococcales bacterium]|nr:response regulator [Magnetococcales bacterium]
MKEIVIVDDEPLLLNLLRRILQEAGYDVVVAATAADALERIRQREPELLICDVFMQNMDGLELIQNAKKLCVGQKIIAMSGGSMSVTPAVVREWSLLLGVVGFLKKPFSRQDVLTEVERVIGAAGHPG